MSKTKNSDFFTKSSFGFYLYLNSKNEKRKISRASLYVASEIGNFLAFKNNSDQNTYKGTMRKFCEYIPFEIVQKAIKELIYCGYIIKESDDRLRLCPDYLEFKKDIDFKVNEARLANDYVCEKRSDFQDYFDVYDTLGSWDKKLSFLKYMIEKNNRNYKNFYKGFYKVLLSEMIYVDASNTDFNSARYGLDYLIKKYMKEDEGYINDILDIYFPLDENTELYKNEKRLEAYKHIKHFITQMALGYIHELK